MKNRVISKKRGNKEKNIHETIYNNFKISLNYIKESRNYIYFSIILFFVVAIFGFIFPFFFIEQIKEIIKELVSRAEGLSLFEMISFIFTNNLRSSFYAILFGSVFGIVPLMVIITNGYILGFVASYTVGEEGFLVLWRLVPHGIFELPAVFISLGLGIRLGLFWAYSKEKARSFLAMITFVLFFLVSSSILLGVASAAYFLSGSIDILNPIEKQELFSSILGNPLFFIPLVLLFILGLIIATLILSKDDKKEFKRCLLNSLKVLLLVVIPLLIIAAIIEGILMIALG